jgi:hypothetical protein
MQHTTIDHVDPRPTSLNECRHHPCVIVQPLTPSTLRTGAGRPVCEAGFYPTRDGEGIFVLWDEEYITVHSEAALNPESDSITRKAAAPRRPSIQKSASSPKASAALATFRSKKPVVFPLLREKRIYSEGTVVHKDLIHPALHPPFPCRRTSLQILPRARYKISLAYNIPLIAITLVTTGPMFPR